MAFNAFCRLLPTCVALKLGRAIGYAISFLIPREKRISEAQMLVTKVAASEADASQIFRRLCVHIGESIAEVLISDRILAGTGSFTEVSLELTKKVKQMGGGIVLSGHIGNFELLAAYFLSVGSPFRPVGRTPNFKVLRKIAEYLRQKNNVMTLWRDDAGAATDIIRMLRNKEVVAALLDQDTKLESLYSPFFNIPAKTPMTLMAVAFRYALPFYTCFIVRVAPLKYEIFAEEISYDPQDPMATEKILLEYHRRLETIIRQYPEQWIWWHRRWRHRPECDSDPTKLRSTAQYIEWLQQGAVDNVDIPKELL